MQTRIITSNFKTENKLLLSLRHHYQEVIFQPTFPWCLNPITQRSLKYDYYLPQFSIIVELDGEQHFKQVLNWTSPQEVLERDVLKMKLALQHGLSVIRLLQVDVWRDSRNWEKELQSFIYRHPEPKVIYLGGLKEYTSHKWMTTNPRE